MKYSLLLSLVLILLTSRPSTPRTIGGRIIGGQNARAGQFPFAAALHVTTPNSRIFCSGVLISSLWVLTSGYCLIDAVSVTVQLGSNTLESPDPNRVTVATDSLVIHPLFDRDTLDNDIALIMFRLHITLNDYIQPTHFFPIVDLPASARVTTFGWGQINDQSPGPVNQLKYVQLSTLSNDECKLVYGSQITDSMVCVEGNYNEGTCTGDSGSPLIQNVAGGHIVLVGVASFLSQNGCESTDPSGYTRVFPYKQWIGNITGILM